GEERIVGGGLGCGQGPIGRGLQDVACRGDIAGHRQGDADNDDEDELDEEQSPRQRPASGPETATISPRWGLLAGSVVRGRYRHGGAVRHGGSAGTGAAGTSRNHRSTTAPR